MGMYIWEIVKGMSEGKYTCGDIFENGDTGRMVINSDGELIWNDTLEIVSIVVGDNYRYELLIF